MARIFLDRLTKRFGKVIALSDFTLEVKDGEFIAILGPSGSGKTTTLYLIAGVYKPTSGKIYFDDQVVNDIPPQYRNIGLVFQSYALYPHMTVYENIAFPLRLKKIPREQIKQKVEKVAKMLHIDELLARKPNQISGGQQQRVALARALVKEPNILLLDEPLSNLDAKLRVATRGEIKRLQKELEITAVLVTHDQIEAMTMAERIAVIHKGKLQQYSTPHDLYSNPENLFVAGFIGNPPMNFLHGRFKKEGDNFKIIINGSEIRIPHERIKQARGEIPSEIIMGIRPEEIAINVSPDESWPRLRGEIYVTEPLGKETLITVSIDGQKISALTTNEDWEIGEHVTLYLNPNRIHIFDPESEARLI